MIERRATIRGVERRALYSEGRCGDPGCYRYLLEIVWLPLNPRRLQVIGLNPSTATEHADDPTVRRLRGWSARLGCGGLLMTNLAAYRSRYPEDMLGCDDPFGPENTPEWLASLDADLVIAAWGANGVKPKLRDRVADIRAVFGDRLQALRLTKKSRCPEHPLYLPGCLQPRPLAELEAEVA